MAQAQIVEQPNTINPVVKSYIKNPYKDTPFYMSPTSWDKYILEFSENSSLQKIILAQILHLGRQFLLI